MNAHALVDTAQALVVADKDLPAIGESNATCNARFAGLVRDMDIAGTAEARRAWRELIVTTPDLCASIGGVILYEETIRQRTTSGIAFVGILGDAGILPGIKVDTGAKDLALRPGEKIAEGLDGLRKRLMECAHLGACFAKGRAEISIGGLHHRRNGAPGNIRRHARSGRTIAHHAVLLRRDRHPRVQRSGCDGQ